MFLWNFVNAFCDEQISCVKLARLQYPVTQVNANLRLLQRYFVDVVHIYHQVPLSKKVGEVHSYTLGEEEGLLQDWASAPDPVSRMPTCPLDFRITSPTIMWTNVLK